MALDNPAIPAMMGTILELPILPVTLMLIAILILNGILALIGFAIARSLWQWRNALAHAADALQAADRATHELLDTAPAGIGVGQIESQRLRQSYRQLAAQVRRLQSVLGLVGWSHQLVRSRSPLLPSFRRRST
jgi:hypothetical protein